jgi:hypothetical protein
LYVDAPDEHTKAAAAAAALHDRVAAQLAGGSVGSPRTVKVLREQYLV